jgi:hypothetical protein
MGAAIGGRRTLLRVPIRHIGAEELAAQVRDDAVALGNGPLALALALKADDRWLLVPETAQLAFVRAGIDRAERLGRRRSIDLGSHALGRTDSTSPGSPPPPRGPGKNVALKSNGD